MSRICILLVIASTISQILAIDWHEENDQWWAKGCDFRGNDLGAVQTADTGCGWKCATTNGCTHFVWAGGMCYMKQGWVDRNWAFAANGGNTCAVMKRAGQGNPAPQPGSSGGNSGTAQGKTTRYWDCCKPSCTWPGKGDVTNPVKACQRDGVSRLWDNNAKNGCEGGGSSYVCNDNQPWAINDNLAYGFAAGNLPGQQERDWCCACYEFTFTSGPVNGKKMVVQIVNTGGDLGHNHFDLQIPGGGVGIFQEGCRTQWNAPWDGWGQRYGGVSSRDQCNQLPQQIRAGCFWRFDWFKNADNPTINLRKVKCPQEIINKSNCKRKDE